MIEDRNLAIYLAKRFGGIGDVNFLRDRYREGLISYEDMKKVLKYWNEKRIKLLQDYKQNDKIVDKLNSALGVALCLANDFGGEIIEEINGQDVISFSFNKKGN